MSTDDVIKCLCGTDCNLEKIQTDDEDFQNLTYFLCPDCKTDYMNSEQFELYRKYKRKKR